MAAAPAAFRHTFANGAEGWTFEAAPVATAQPAGVVRWLGRKSLRLGDGGALLAPVHAAPPYTLRATLSGGPGECYVGFCFHAADAENYETIYLAPQAGGEPSGVQYDPVINGSHTWQIFGDVDGVADPAALARAPLRREHWHRFRLDVWPAVACAYLEEEGAQQPVLVGTFPLRSGRQNGRAGLWAFRESYAADFAVEPLGDPAPPVSAPKAIVPPGVVREWLVARRDPGRDVLTDHQCAAVEHNGILCLNRFFRFERGGCAYAACEVEVPAGAERVELEIGYSDCARVWWEGDLVHEGEARWDSEAGTDGRIRLDHARVPLRAAPGRHTLLTEVSLAEPPFGWGLIARVTADGVPCDAYPAMKLAVPHPVPWPRL